MIYRQRRKKSETKLELANILEMLEQDKLIDPQQRIQLIDLVASNKTYINQHPLITISCQNWSTKISPNHPLTAEYLTKWLAEKLEHPYLRIDPLKVDVQKATNIISQTYARKLQILPIKVDPSYEYLVVATSEPFITSWETELANISKCKQIKRVLVNPYDLQRYITEFYGVSRSITGASNKNTLTNPIQNLEQLLKVGSETPDANDQHIVSVVDWLLQFAFEQRASDIHLEPRKDKGNIRLRIDGILHLVQELPPSLMTAMISRLKALGRMDVTDRRRPQDGRLKTISPNNSEVELRLSTMPIAFGEKLVIRIFNPDILIKNFMQLGLSQHNNAMFNKMLGHSHGVILITGPTGSGKTTTLYSALHQLARPELNICTIEDPIEMIEPQFNQLQVLPSIDLSFAVGVKTLLRQDPDVIMIGEIRDRETADIAIQAALTGHLVLSSLHTNDASSAVTRLIDIGIQPFLINSTLQGVVAQRLIRMLCPYCKELTKTDKQAWLEFCHPHKFRMPEKIYRAVGCDECRQTGYLDRIGIYEILEINEQIKKQINVYCDPAQLRETAVAHGMHILKFSGAQKIISGLTTMEEVYTAIPHYQV